MRKLINFVIPLLFVIGDLCASDVCDKAWSIKIDPRTLNVVELEYVPTKKKCKAPKPIAGRGIATISDLTEFLNSRKSVPNKSLLNINEIVSAHFPEKECARELGYIGEETNRIILALLFKEMGADVKKYDPHNTSNNGHDAFVEASVGTEKALFIIEAKIKGEQSLNDIYNKTYSAPKIKGRNEKGEETLQECFTEFMQDPNKIIYTVVFTLQRNGKSRYLVEELDKKIYPLELGVAALRKFRAEDPEGTEANQQAKDVALDVVEMWKTPPKREVAKKALQRISKASPNTLEDIAENLGKKRTAEDSEDLPKIKRMKALAYDLAECSPDSMERIITYAREISKNPCGSTTAKKLNFDKD